MDTIYRIGHLTFGIWIGYKKKNLWIFFQKYGFIRKIEPFNLRIKYIIQMTATTGLTVPHSTNTRFKMLHKSRWNVKMYITLTTISYKMRRLWLCSYESDNLDNVTHLWLVTKRKDTLSLLLALPRNNGADVVSSVSFGVRSCREFPLPF